MADNLQTKTEKLIKYGNEKFGLNETSLRGILDNASAGKYNIEVIEEADGTQTLNITDWDYVSTPKFDPVLANNTPQQIKYVSSEIEKNGYNSTQVKEIFGWDLQTDTIPITLTTGEIIHVRIIGFLHDDKGDDTGKVGITFEMVDCLATDYVFNTERTNAGGYTGTPFYLETIPTLLDLFPEEWKEVMVEVKKVTAMGGNINYTGLDTSNMKIFLPSQVEYYGTDYVSERGQAQDLEEEGTQYEYWVGKDFAEHIKYQDTTGDGVANTYTHYWTRSSDSLWAKGFVSVYIDGTITSVNPTSASGISLAFCV